MAKWPEYPDDKKFPIAEVMPGPIPTEVRPDWDEYFLQAAEWAALRGDCTRRQVGAVIVWGRRVWASGCNGTEEPGIPGCLDGACPRGRKSPQELAPYAGDYSDCIAKHAEENAIAQFDVIRSVLEIKTNLRRDWGCPAIYVSQKPCDNCQDLILNNGLIGHWRK